MRVEVQRLAKKQGINPLFNLEHICFEAGKITGITGDNGVGKTTFLRILAGLDRCYEGFLTYDGLYKVTQSSAVPRGLRRQISYLPQSPYMLDRSVFENIAYPLTLRENDRGRNQEEMINILKELELETLKSQRATQISSGEAQRVALARGLIYCPRLLLLDEATANIDQNLTIAVESLIKRRVKESGMTAIVVSHDLEQLKRWCDKIFILEAGKCTELVL